MGTPSNRGEAADSIFPILAIPMPVRTEILVIVFP
jgi:hypothetical protein